MSDDGALTHEPDLDNASVGKEKSCSRAYLDVRDFIIERTINMENGKNGIQRKITTETLAVSAMLIAMATVLSYFTFGQWPYGGSITLGSMIPIVLISLKYPFAWSALTALAYSLIQMMQGFYAPPVENIVNYTLMILLDYVIAFGVLSLAGPIFRHMSQNHSVRVRIMSAAVTCFILRFVCHFISGLIIWGYYAPEGQPVWIYSLVYNGPYMLAESVIGGVILFFSGKMLLELFIQKNPN